MQLAGRCSLEKAKGEFCTSERDGDGFCFLIYSLTCLYLGALCVFSLSSHTLTVILLLTMLFVIRVATQQTTGSKGLQCRVPENGIK